MSMSPDAPEKQSKYRIRCIVANLKRLLDFSHLSQAAVQRIGKHEMIHHLDTHHAPSFH